jgi:hypothetical protein
MEKEGGRTSEFMENGDSWKKASADLLKKGGIGGQVVEPVSSWKKKVLTISLIMKLYLHATI